MDAGPSKAHGAGVLVLEHPGEPESMRRCKSLRGMNKDHASPANSYKSLRVQGILVNLNTLPAQPMLLLQESF